MSSTARLSNAMGSSTANNVSADARVRRPSQEGGSLFAGLHHVKRGSMDEASLARRASLHDAQAKSGFLGQLWTNWTRGPPPSMSPTLASPPTSLK